MDKQIDKGVPDRIVDGHPVAVAKDYAFSDTIPNGIHKARAQVDHERAKGSEATAVYGDATHGGMTDTLPVVTGGVPARDGVPTWNKK